MSSTAAWRATVLHVEELGAWDGRYTSVNIEKMLK
jgi:hypothetical protein